MPRYSPPCSCGSAIERKLPWPIPVRPVRVDICQSSLEKFSIVVGLEAWDKDDPRAVATFRCEGHVQGRAFPDTILLHRVQFRGLRRVAATEIFSRLVNF